MTNAREFIPRAFESPLLGGWITQTAPSMAYASASLGDAVALAAQTSRPCIVCHFRAGDADTFTAYESSGEILRSFRTFEEAEAALRRPRFAIRPLQSGLHEVWLGDSYVASFYRPADAEFYIAAREMK